MRIIKSTILVGSLLLAGNLSATVINGTGLQDLLNDITVENASDPLSSVSSVDVQNDQIKRDEAWALTASGGSVSTLVLQLSEVSADFESFGVYDYSDPENYVEIFDDEDVADSDEEDGLSRTFSLKSSGKVYISDMAYKDENGESVYFARNKFGYYLTVDGQTFYSQESLNAPAILPAPGGDAPGGDVPAVEGVDHMVAYSGQGDLVDLPGVNPGTWTANEFILAWEDELLSNSDRDYDDFVVMVESVKSVPEPAILFALGLGLAAFGFAAKRRS